MRISHNYIFVFYLLIAFMQISTAEISKIPKVQKEYDFMCGCKNIFYKNQFEPSEEHFEFSTPSIDISYSGQSDKIVTSGIDDSYFFIPDEVVKCYMAGRYSRLTGYFLTEPKKYFKIWAEYYDTSGSIIPLETKNFSGTPFWRKFDFYFDLVGMPDVKKIAIYAKSPVDLAEEDADDTIYPLYLDEFRICRYCDGTISDPIPALKKLEANTGELIFLSENNFTLNVSTETSSLKIKPILDPVFTGCTIKVNDSNVSSGSFSQDISLNSDPGKTTFIYVEVSKSVCERNIYIIEVKKNEGPDATLSNLKTTDGVIAPDFYRFQNNYTISVGNEVSTLRLVPIANDHDATIKVDGQTVETATESQNVNVPVDRIVPVVVTARDGLTQRTYNVMVVHETPKISFISSSGIGLETLANPVIKVEIYPVPKSPHNFTVQYEIESSSTATPGEDYTLASGTLTFNQSNIKQTIPLNIINDEIPDGGETVVIRLTNPTGGATLGINPTYTYTIKDIIIYVKSGAAGNGSTWTNAMGDLNDALAASIPGNEIWMAGADTGDGMVYKPGPAGGPHKYRYWFSVNKGISIYGGFPGNAGDEGKREMQNWTTYKTVLDGDLNGDDGNIWPPDSDKIYDNAHNVIQVVNQGLSNDNKVSFNGLVVKNGNAGYWRDGGSDCGGGILVFDSNVEIKQCIFKNNHAKSGGAIDAVFSIITVNKTVIEQNRSLLYGGGCNFGAITPKGDFLKMKFTDNYVIGNSCDNGEAGGIYIYLPDEVIFSNNVIAGNKAEYSYGGGIVFNLFDSCNIVKITNCTFVRNSSLCDGGGVFVFTNYCDITPIIFENTIFWENSTTIGAMQVNVYNSDSLYGIMNYCAMNGGLNDTNVSGIIIPGNRNIDCIPDFVNPVNDFHIGTNSNCIDKGTEVEAPATDIEGKGRYDHPGHVNVRSNVDIGAYEYNPAP